MFMITAKTLLLFGTLIGSITVGALAKKLTSRSVARPSAGAAVPGLCDIRFEDGVGNRVETEIKVLTDDLSVRMPFRGRDDASTFVSANAAAFVSAFHALAPHVSTQFQKFRGCLGYDKTPHRLAKLYVHWNLAAGKRRLVASRFELNRVEGHPREPLVRCFDEALKLPVTLDGAPEPGGLLTYSGGAPAFLVYQL